MLQALLERAAAVVAHGAAGALDLDTLCSDAAAVAAELPPPSPGSMVTFAFGRDRRAFAAALLGTWWAGHGAALPENDLREYVEPILDSPQSVAFLHDTGSGSGIDVRRLLATPRTGALPPLPLPEPSRIVLETHTANGDGGVDVGHWNSVALLAEIDGLVAQLGLAPGATVAHAFTPAFLPAVLVGLLVPLRAGGRFLLDPPAGRDGLAEAAHDGAVLLCSRAEVRALCGLPTGSLPAEVTIVSHGTPSAHVADVLLARHGAHLETVLAATLGRADNCAEALREVDGIADAAVACLPATGATLVAFVGPDEAKPRVEAAAAELLGRDTALHVRAVPALARCPNGRIPHAELCVRFDRGRDGGEVTRVLHWRRLTTDAEDGERFVTLIPQHYAFFIGHFAGYPVLAGGVQLEALVLPCVRAARLAAGMLRRLDAVKFFARIEPGDEVEVALRARDDGRRIDFEISRGGTRCTSGRLSFAGHPDARDGSL